MVHIPLALPVVSPSTYLAFSLILSTSWFLQLNLRSKFSLPTLLSLLTLLHTLYTLQSLFVSPPEDVFRDLHLPINVHPDALATSVASLWGNSNRNFRGATGDVVIRSDGVPAHLELLMKRMNLVDMRGFYIRFGHKVLTTCLYCQSYSDFALYALPNFLLEYIWEIAFVGLLTLPPSSDESYFSSSSLQPHHLRPFGLGAVLASLLAEVYVVLTVPVIIPSSSSQVPISSNQVIMWHDGLTQLRHILFLLLPPLLFWILPAMGQILRVRRAPTPSSAPSNIPAAQHAHFQNTPNQSHSQPQPSPFSLPPNMTLRDISTLTLQTLAHLVPTLHLVKYVHAAVMRSQEDEEEGEGPIDHNQGGPDSRTRMEADSSTETLVPGADSSEANKTSKESKDKHNPALHALATQWWAAEAREGRVLRTDKEVKRVLRGAGIGIDFAEGEVGLPGEEGTEELPPLPKSAAVAVDMIKMQGAAPSVHWVVPNEQSSSSPSA